MQVHHIIQFILEYSDLTIAQQQLADFNIDGQINVVDIVGIVNLILNTNIYDVLTYTKNDLEKFEKSQEV